MLIGWIAISGAAGTALRFGLAQGLGPWMSAPLPTLAINALGSLAIGAVAGASGPSLSPTALVITVGFLGGFTTFSAYSLEVVRMAGEGKTLAALAYGAGAPAVCIALAALGLFAGQTLVTR